MEHSKLLTDIIIRAEEIQKTKQTAFISAPCIIAAVAEFCACEYKGITNYDQNIYPEHFEEEGLRYIFKKVFKSSASLLSLFYKSKQRKGFSRYDFDFLKEYKSVFEKLAKERKKLALSADMVFLVAVNSLNSSHRPSANAEFCGQFSVEKALLQIDENIYDYVITENNKIIERLKSKICDAKAKRDWRPAAKFMEPDDLLCSFLSYFTTKALNGCLEIKIPHYFGDDNTLNLTVCKNEGIYYVHDNGGALNQLKKHAKTPQNFENILNAISENLSLENGNVVGCFSQTHTFLHYLQILIFVSHADLFYKELHPKGLESDLGISFPKQTQHFDTDRFIDKLSGKFQCFYDENRGLCLRIYTSYALNPSPVEFLIETLENDKLKISDAKKGELEGEIFESFYWGNNELSNYSDYIKGFCKRFEADFNGENISLTANYGCFDDFVCAFFKFMNLAVLLSEFGRMIELPQ